MTHFLNDNDKIKCYTDLQEGVIALSKQKIDLGGCKLILKSGKAPRLKVPKGKRREIKRLMGGGLELADKGIAVAGKKMKGVVARVPSFRRKVRKGGKKLTRKLGRSLK